MGAVPKQGDKKLSLMQFIWLGFNYTVGIGFIGNLAILSNFKNKEGINMDSVGVHIIWIFLLLGIIASICALAFAKLTKIHKSDNNGGAYLMARTTYGRFVGWVVVFMQYVILPFLITVQIFNLLKAFFSGHYAGETGLNLEGAMKGSEHWAPLILDLAGVVVYFSFSLVILGGMKLFKKMTESAGYIKWATSFILIIAAVYLASIDNSAANNYSQWFDSGNDPFTNQSTKVGFNAFIKAFNSCFFFFAGFETFSTAGKNIRNPEKNLGKGILIIMLSATLFYISMIFLFFAAMNPSDADGGFIQNMNMGLWTKEAFKNAAGKLSWVAYAGMGVMIVSQVALKANVSMQNALYGGTMIQPMSQEGYISEKYSALNKDGLPVKASILNFVVTLFVLTAWLIIPDLIQGITKSDKAIFSVSDLTEASSAITLFIYFIIMIVLLTLAGRKKIKIKVIEWIAYTITTAAILFMFVYHYFELFQRLWSSETIEALKSGDAKLKEAAVSKIVGASVELAFVISSVIVSIIIYFAYYKPKLKKRLSTPEGIELQKKLDSEFVLIGSDVRIFYRQKDPGEHDPNQNSDKSENKKE